MISRCFFYAWTLFSQKSPDFRYFPRAIILHILRTFGRQDWSLPPPNREANSNPFYHWSLLNRKVKVGQCTVSNKAWSNVDRGKSGIKKPMSKHFSCFKSGLVRHIQSQSHTSSIKKESEFNYQHKEKKRSYSPCHATTCIFCTKIKYGFQSIWKLPCNQCVLWTGNGKSKLHETFYIKVLRSCGQRTY